MRRLVLVLLVVTGMTPAFGQVTVNQRALEQLGGVPLPAPPPRQPAHRYVRRYYYRPLPLPPPYVPKPMPVIAVTPPPRPAPPPVPPLALTMTFPGNTPDMPPPAAQALKTLIAVPRIKSDHFTIAATAPGIKGDPSVARRLSLNRALAVRARLRAAGVPSEHIIVQALGSPPGQADDRVTLTQTP